MQYLIKSNLLSMSCSEFNQFILQLIRITGRKIFIELLFEHCIEHVHKNNAIRKTKRENIKLIDTISIISSIITRRHKHFAANTHQTKQISNNFMNKLPSSLLSNTASYLSYCDYFNFARCCIKTYISCHLPCKLQHLPLRKYPINLSLQRFKWIKSLVINLKYFNEYYNENKHKLSIWNENCLETLKLSNLNGNESDTATFMNNNSITFNKTKLSKLALANFGTNLCGYNGILFGKLLTNFNMISELVLWDIHLTKGYILNECDIRKWFPNLKRLVCTYNVNKQLTQTIIHCIGHKLQALALWQVNNIKVNTFGFPKLEELVLYMHGYSSILECFENAKVNLLSRVKISSDNEKMLNKAICWIFKTQNNLCRLQINIQSKYLSYVMHKVCENMVMNMNMNNKLSKKKNKYLVIGFHCNWNDGIVDFLEEMVVKLRDLLCNYNNNLSDFALRVRMENRRRYNQINGDDIWLNMVENWLNKLNAMNAKFNTIYQFTTVHCTDIFTFTISNKNCKIQGYHHNFIDLL